MTSQFTEPRDITTGQQNQRLCLNHRALYNRRNFLLCVIPPILGAFYNNEKKYFVIDIEQAISQ